MTAAPSRRGTAICFVTDRHATGGRALSDIVRAAVEGGVDLVQLREKDLGGAELLRLARTVVEIAKSARGRCRVVVNDRLDVALAAKAAGVHLGAEGLPTDAVRRVGGARHLIGRSVHSPAEARQAAKERVDYLVCGPVFETPSKAAYGPPLGTEALRRIAGSVRVPVWAIGGITPENAAELRGLPIAGIAVIRAIAAAPDPAAAVRNLRAALLGDGDI